LGVVSFVGAVPQLASQAATRRLRRRGGDILARMKSTADPAASNPAASATLGERLESVRGRIAAAAAAAGRHPGEIALVAVTKNASIDQIRELIGLGQVDLGENRVQQLVQRAAQIDESIARRRQLPEASADAPRLSPPRWHMIGRLQRNKIRKAVELSRLIHGVDSLRLAEEIQLCASRRETPIEILVQVNVAGERSKGGVVPAAAKHLVDQIETMVNVKARGLMCMAPLGPEGEADLDAARRTFDRCRELFEDIRASGSGGDRFDLLSMGMSGDFEAAIASGANLVRVGSALFGDATPDLGGDEDDAEQE
jgi:pyridoxal phosphate enzyme (YggS family)